MDAAQIAALARGAGITDPDALSIAVAVALAESGGNPASHNTKGLDDSYGLWQINMKIPNPAQRRRAIGITSDSQLLDPATNARAMFVISNGGKNWGPWTTYTTGKYLTHLPTAQAAVKSGGSVVTQPAFFPNPLDPFGAADAIKAGINTVTAIQDWVTNRHNWVRVGWTALGVGFIFVAASAVAGKQTLSAAGKITKVVPIPL